MTKESLTKGALHYTANYTGDIVRREVGRLLHERGLFGGLQALAISVLKNIRADLYYAMCRPVFEFRGSRLRYFSGTKRLLSGSPTLPFTGRFANIFSKLDTERAIEIPVAEMLLRRHEGKHILEVGNVLAYYCRDLNHTVVDLYEVAPGVINQDALTFEPQSPFDLIISVSTIEHVGFDEPNLCADKPIRVLRHLQDLLAPGGVLFVTFPLGYNPTLDAYALMFPNEGFDCSVFVREPESMVWVGASLSEHTLRGMRILMATYRRQGPT